MVADVEAKPELLKAMNERPGLVEAWEKLDAKGMSLLARNPKALTYMDDLKSKAKLGTSTTTDHRKTFKDAFPELKADDFIVHHAIEQQVLTKYPGLISSSEMHSLQNLRGIPKSVNSDIHLSQIRSAWNQFYRSFDVAGTVPTKQQLLDKATEIDNMLGAMFNPPLR